MVSQGLSFEENVEGLHQNQDLKEISKAFSPIAKSNKKN